MLAFILQVIQRTPLWVWPLFVALVWLGFLQSRTRALHRVRLFVLPATMLGLSLFGVGSTFGAAPLSFAAWGCGIVLAVLLNLLLRQPRGAAYSAAARTFTVPGSWLPLALIMVIFFTRYAITVAIAINPPLREAAAFAGSASLAYGLMSGTFFARALHVLRTAR